ncbi:glutaredoxin domain-containing protein, partial [Actinokineospora sp.]|uniref:glutaredoxin domain-containing protein n=1 Tax=Actinokineospora sp. TaxID=1872133 RepID=UPI003D6A52DE
MTDAVEFYWRPSRPFCMVLRSGLRLSGLPLREVDIWKDPEAAARVRSVADGNETVPTVFVGSHAMVNPSMRQVLTAIRDHAPNLTPTATPSAPVWRPVIAALGFGLLWLLLATRSPTTT